MELHEILVTCINLTVMTFIEDTALRLIWPPMYVPHAPSQRESTSRGFDAVFAF